MKDNKLLPSILAADHGRFVKEANTVDLPQIDMLHVDVMDGHFVPNITFGPGVVSSLKRHTRFSLDVHLMIETVDVYIPRFAEAGADIITIHQEANAHLQRSLQLIRECGAKAGIALNPATSLETIKWIYDDLDLVLIMSVNPGFGGQKFIPSSVEKIEALRKDRDQLGYSFIIEVDGGIDKETAPLVFDAGASYLVAGSSIFGKPDRKGAIHDILKAIDKHQSKKKSVYT